jgi:hypothetical protein
MSELSPNDLVLYSNSDGKMYSGGFNINSIFLNKELSPIFNINTSSTQYGGNNVSELFDNLAIPRGLLYLNDRIEGGNNQRIPIENDESSENDVINDDIYNKLLNSVELKKSKHIKTKNKKHKKKGTKKH